MALWLGVLTSISPCPLATNIAAMSFIGKRVDDIGHVLFSGLIYTVGRSAVYILLGVFIIASLLSIQEIAIPLQRYMNQALGPVMIVAGMFMLDLIKLSIPGMGSGKTTMKLAGSDSVLSAGLLGVLFALAFCPVSAAMFFGGLIPLSVKDGSSILYPLLYGIGTAIPVVLFAVIIAFGAGSVSRVFNSLSGLESYARKGTGVLFTGIGVFYCLRYLFHIL